VILRPVQTECLSAVWKDLTTKDDVLVQLPTGGGKTIIFSELTRLVLNNYPDVKACILVNKIKLVEQTKEKLLNFLPPEKISLFCGSIGEYDDQASAVIGSIQSISFRTHVFNLLIIDEAHNAEDAPTYLNYIDRLKKANPKLKIVRFTATPYTLGGYIYGPEKPIKKLTFKRTLNQMVEAGDLVPPIFKNVKGSFDTSQLRTKRGEFIMSDVEKMSKDQEKVRRQVEDALPRLSARNKIVWAATCIEHAKLLKAEIEVFEKASVVHSELSKKERARQLDEFENGETRHLISIQIVTEGYDHPPIDGIVIMTATRSPVKYVQLVGRGLRLSPGKKDCLVLDYGEVVEYLGHPSDPYVPNTGKKKVKGEKLVILCPACDTINFLPVRVCHSCSYEFVRPEPKGRDATKALTTQAAEIEFNKDGVQEMILDVLTCTVNNDYITKKGEPCVKVTYSTMQGMVHDYLKKGTFFHRKWNTETLANKSTPKKILVHKKGKYFELVRRIYK
jgi:DNA repair protein RadD